jgi:D-serine deaminase-like pyridoxal phosphate-dependent protein
VKRIPVCEIETPALLLDMDALEQNIRVMGDFFKGKSSKLRPHFKTDKCPRISHMQIAAGAKGITCSKLGEAEVLAAAGIKDILIANQIVSPEKLLRVAGLAKSGVRLTMLADDAGNVRDIAEAAKACGTEIRLLVEIDVGMGRCGVNTAEEALALARVIVATDGVIFEGIQAYEGHLSHNPVVAERRAGVDGMIKKVTGAVELLKQNGIAVNEISGGGTGTYDLTGDNTIWTEIQAGSYLFMDLEYNKLGLKFEQALTVLTSVIHKRDGFAVTDAGMKTCGTDQGLPEIKGHPEIAVALNEEHGKLADVNNALRLGQKVEYLPGHCCTAVNLNDEYYCVRGGYLEAVWPIAGRGKTK